MIGMPRITLISPALRPASTPIPDTRISAQNSPSTVDNASEPIVTTIVSQTPCIRIGTNSTASLKNFCIGSDQGCVLLRERHVAQDVGNGVVDLDLAEQPGLFQYVYEGRSDLGAHDLALEIFLRRVILG